MHGGEAVAETLRRRREALGKSALDIARALGVHRSTVYRWEAGAAIPAPALAGYLREVGWTWADLDEVAA